MQLSLHQCIIIIKRIISGIKGIYTKELTQILSPKQNIKVSASSLHTAPKLNPSLILGTLKLLLLFLFSIYFNIFWLITCHCFYPFFSFLFIFKIRFLFRWRNLRNWVFWEICFNRIHLRWFLIRNYCCRYCIISDISDEFTNIANNTLKIIWKSYKLLFKSFSPIFEHMCSILQFSNILMLSFIDITLEFSNSFHQNLPTWVSLFNLFYVFICWFEDLLTFNHFALLWQWCRTWKSTNFRHNRFNLFHNSFFTNYVNNNLSDGFILLEPRLKLSITFHKLLCLFFLRELFPSENWVQIFTRYVWSTAQNLCEHLLRFECHCLLEDETIKLFIISTLTCVSNIFEIILDFWYCCFTVFH